MERIVECGFGNTISEEFRTKAIPLAKMHPEDTVAMEANGIKFIADSTTPEDLVDKCIEDCFTYDIHECGPQYVVISEETRKIKDFENSFKSTKYEAERKAQMAKESYFKSKVEELIKDTEFATSKPDELAKIISVQTHPYSKAALDYGLTLGRLLQLHPSYPNVPEEMVKLADNMLGYFGITGFQHSAGMAILRDVWDGYATTKWPAYF